LPFLFVNFAAPMLITSGDIDDAAGALKAPTQRSEDYRQSGSPANALIMREIM